jgi:hypothetical protein
MGFSGSQQHFKIFLFKTRLFIGYKLGKLHKDALSCFQPDWLESKTNSAGSTWSSADARETEKSDCYDPISFVAAQTKYMLLVEGMHICFLRNYRDFRYCVSKSAAWLTILTLKSRTHDH